MNTGEKYIAVSFLQRVKHFYWRDTKQKVPAEGSCRVLAEHVGFHIGYLDKVILQIISLFRSVIFHCSCRLHVGSCGSRLRCRACWTYSPSWLIIYSCAIWISWLDRATPQVAKVRPHRRRLRDQPRLWSAGGPASIAMVLEQWQIHKAWVVDYSMMTC